LWEEIRLTGMFSRGWRYVGTLEVEEDDEPFEREDATAGGKVGGAVYPQCKARGKDSAKS
jgi:hypothetical protein